MLAQQQPEHKWLERLVGEWAWEMTAPNGPDQPPTTHTGTESVRSLNVWVQCVGNMPGADGAPATTVMTLGFDPTKGKYLGTFIGSMMTHMWVYEGTADASGNKLVLDAEGPSFADPTKTAKYQDTIEFLSPDHRVLSSRYRAEDGTWHQFMEAHYHRKA
jgi:hypothetical protein